MFHVFWNALLFLTNLAKASMPVFVPKRVASWWSGAPSSIISPYSSCNQHSNTMCSRVCSPAPHGLLVGSCVLWVWYYSLKYPCPVLACVTIPSMRRSSVQNACEPASEGGMQSDMAYCPAIGFLSHSIVHSVFSLARSCLCSFTMVVVSVAGSSSVASFAKSSALGARTKGQVIKPWRAS